MTGERVSFSALLKNEIARIYPESRCCRVAELSAILHAIGRLHIHGEKRFSLEAHVENAAVARKIYRLLTELFNLPVEVTVRRAILHRANDYLVAVFAPSLLGALNELGLIDENFHVDRGLPGRLISKRCCAEAYLRGAFLGGGFASDPKGEYHFELATENASFAEGLKSLLESFLLHPGLVERPRNCAVYLKSSEEILKVLAMIGAHNALMAWEDARIVKEMRSEVNRLVNCDTANLRKAAAAAVSQMDDIRVIDGEMGLGKLPNGLREIARLRLDNPSVNLRELGELLDPPLNKTAVYHRMRRLAEIAESIRSTV